MRRPLVLALLVVLAGCASSGDTRPAAPSPLQREITGLVTSMADLHPDVDHQIPLPRLRAEARKLAARAPELSRDQLVVGLLGLTTLGERDGHGGIFTTPRMRGRSTSTRSGCTTSPTASTSSRATTAASA